MNIVGGLRIGGIGNIKSDKPESDFKVNKTSPKAKPKVKPEPKQDRPVNISDIAGHILEQAEEEIDDLKKFGKEGLNVSYALKECREKIKSLMKL